MKAFRCPKCGFWNEPYKSACACGQMITIPNTLIETMEGMINLVSICPLVVVGYGIKKFREVSRL
jgi:hypothetical protein